MLLEFDSNAAFALGARMHDFDWGIVVTNLDGEVVHRSEIRIPDNAPTSAIATLKKGVEATMASVNRDRLMPAIGLGTPGLVDIHSGIIKSAVDVGWFDVPIRQMAEDALGTQTFVANRSKVGALAELWCVAAAAGIRDLIYISIGTGVASGIIHEGQLYIGANSSAGELGHTTVLPDGPLCPCGNHGCLQQIVSGPAIANRARERLRVTGGSLLTTLAGGHPERLTAQDVFRAASQNDPLALEVIEETASFLAIAVANLINLFNPALIVLGGPVGGADHLLTDMLQELVPRRAMAFPLSAVQIRTSSLGSDAGAIGASVLVLQEASKLLFGDA
jgi:glucokinase-like ROK family protein